MGWRLLPMLLAAASLLPLAAAGTASGGRDRYGGITSLRGKATGWFHTQKLGGRWWLVTPEGHAFYSKGVNHVSYWGDSIRQTKRSPYHEAASKKHGSHQAFAKAVVERMRGWGFNTLGSWANPEIHRLHTMPYTPTLNLMASVQRNAWLKGLTPDVFDPAFERAVRQRAARALAQIKDDPWCIGFFTDNEISWGPDWRTTSTLLERAMGLKPGAPGRLVAMKVLAERYADNPKRFDQTYGLPAGSYQKVAELKALPAVRTNDALADEAAYQALFAARYFKVCHDAIRAVDSHHLILGCRFAYDAPEPAVAASKGFIDVFSINLYAFHPGPKRLTRYARLSAAPLMVGEFGFRGKDSGLPNTRGAGPIVPTQADRAACFETFVRELAALPFTVGFAWFEHADEPAEGRFDGENSNYGLVNIRDEPYLPLVERVTKVNDQIEGWATAAVTAR